MNSKLAWLVKFKEKSVIDIIKLLLFFFIIFTFSLNLFYKISLSGAFVHGLLLDYLIPKVYLTELFLIPFLILEAWQLRKVKLNSLLCLLVLLLLARQLLSTNPLAAFTHLIHFTEILLFFTVVKSDPLFRHKLAEKFALGVMFSTVIFQSLLAIYQFIFQKSLLNYQFLGETNLRDLANISKTQFFFSEKILPYGTLPHPNILAGLVVIFSIVIINKIKGCPKTKIVLVLNSLLIIYLTQSLTALITLGLYFLYQFINKLKNKKMAIFFVYYFFLIVLPYGLTNIANKYPNSNSINRRVVLNEAALEMFKENTFFGVGINNFTLKLEAYSNGAINNEVVRFVQPVHNLLLLILSEGGVLLFLIILLLIRQSKIENFYTKSIILLGIASLDHYLFSQFSGIGMLALFYFFI